MRFFRKYGAENTDLTLTDKAKKAYDDNEYGIREYYTYIEDEFSRPGDFTYEIWSWTRAVYTDMTADDVNEFFENLADEDEEEGWG